MARVAQKICFPRVTGNLTPIQDAWGLRGLRPHSVGPHLAPLALSILSTRATNEPAVERAGYVVATQTRREL